MKLTPEQIENIILMAELFFTPAEISVNIEAHNDEFLQEINTTGSDAWKAYTTGKIKGEFKLRTGIMTAAEHGSHPAQQLMLQIKADSEVKSAIDA
jgi:hypothetical protein